MDDFERLIRAHWDGLCRLARLLAGRDLNADDLMGATLLRAVRSRNGVMRAESPQAYLRRILVNVATDEANASARRRRIDASETPPLTAELASGLNDRAELWPLIAGLPPRQRAVVVLRFYEDLPEREIAQILRCRPGTVKSQCAAALDKLRVALAPAPATEGDARGE